MYKILLAMMVFSSLSADMTEARKIIQENFDKVAKFQAERTECNKYYYHDVGYINACIMALDAIDRNISTQIILNIQKDNDVRVVDCIRHKAWYFPLLYDPVNDKYQMIRVIETDEWAFPVFYPSLAVKNAPRLPYETAVKAWCFLSEENYGFD